MIARFIFFLKCVWYFRRTPNGMDRFFSDLLLSIDEFEPTTVLDYLATTNGGTNIILSHETQPDIALNYTTDIGLGIQMEITAPTITAWLNFYSRSKSLVRSENFFIGEMRRLLRLKLESRVRPLPVTSLREPI